MLLMDTSLKNGLRKHLFVAAGFAYLDFTDGLIGAGLLVMPSQTPAIATWFSVAFASANAACASFEHP